MTRFQEEVQEAPPAGAGGSGGKDDRKKIPEIILAALPCLCAFLLMGTYVLELFPRLNLAAVNLTCLFLACLKLFPGIIGTVNRRKTGNFASSLAIALAALAVNLRGQMPGSLSALSAWEALWAGAAAVSAVCLAAVLLRLLRWSQKSWEQERNAAQERRRERREKRRKWWGDWRKYWADRLTARREYSRGRAEARREYRKQMREARRTSRLVDKDLRQSKKRLEKMMEVWEWQQAWRDLTAGPAERSDPQSPKEPHQEENKNTRPPRILRRVPGWGWAIIIAASVAVVCGTAALLIWIPTIQGLSGGVEDWFQAVRDMIVPLIILGINRGSNDEPVTPEEIGTEQVLLFYLMIVILCAVILVVAVYLMIMLLKRIWTGSTDRGNNADDGNFNLLTTYADSFAILLVSFIALYTLSSGKLNVKWFANSWSSLFFTILFILMLLTAFELVRLVLEQCGQAGSVLKRIIYLFFIAALDFLTEVIFGVLKGLHIENAISSILALVLPGDPDKIPAQALEKCKRIFQCQIRAVHETKNGSGNANAGTPADDFSPGHTEPERKDLRGNRIFRRDIWRKRK